MCHVPITADLRFFRIISHWSDLPIVPFPVEDKSLMLAGVKGFFVNAKLVFIRC